MNCKDWEERIALQAGGDLTLEEAAAVDHHLADCAQCRETQRHTVGAWICCAKRTAGRSPRRILPPSGRACSRSWGANAGLACGGPGVGGWWRPLW